ncbi:sensor histidine kinase [Zhengella sp. ZM62]|uniref:sensor histidine kinase n=1 Tax=Zhengella sedimenti TaxID=3390035 RepID=UPI0039763908
MDRLARIDITELARPLPAPLSAGLFGLLCSVVAVGLRMLTDVYLPGAGPFALAVPVVLIATLFGGLAAGIVCQTIAGLHAWYFVLPVAGSFSLQDLSDGPRVFVNLASGYLSVLLAEIFRRAARKALHDREMLLVELEHRVKNSFASIASIMRMQMRDAAPEAKALLQAALGRIESYARAYGYLRFQFDDTGSVHIDEYLRDLCAALEETATADRRIAFSCDAERLPINRDKAIVIGLLVNEVATNSIKHAFGEGKGRITVRFRPENGRQVLAISDNGHGIADEGGHGGKPGLGMRLIEALAQQGNGTVERTSGPGGTTFTITFNG